MALPRPLSRPPITEALVDLRIAADTALTFERLAPLRERLADRFPAAEQRRQYQAELKVEAGKLLPPEARDLGLAGLWLTSDGGQWVAQFRSDGFTLNNLRGYVGGDVLLAQALELWQLYADIARPIAVSRLGLRYLNSIELPLREGEDFKRYLAAPAELPPGAPRQVSSFLSRVVGHEEPDFVVIATQKLEPSPTPPVSVLVDVEAVCPRAHDPTAEALRSTLNYLRDLKNRTFFALLTEETVNLYI